MRQWDLQPPRWRAPSKSIFQRLDNRSLPDMRETWQEALSRSQLDDISNNQLQDRVRALLRSRHQLVYEAPSTPGRFPAIHELEREAHRLSNIVVLRRDACYVPTSQASRRQRFEFVHEYQKKPEVVSRGHDYDNRSSYRRSSRYRVEDSGSSNGSAYDRNRSRSPGPWRQRSPPYRRHPCDHASWHRGRSRSRSPPPRESRRRAISPDYRVDRVNSSRRVVVERDDHVLEAPTGPKASRIQEEHIRTASSQTDMTSSKRVESTRIEQRKVYQRSEATNGTGSVSNTTTYVDHLLTRSTIQQDDHHHRRSPLPMEIDEHDEDPYAEYGKPDNETYEPEDFRDIETLLTLEI